MVTTIVEIAV